MAEDRAMTHLLIQAVEGIFSPTDPGIPPGSIASHQGALLEWPPEEGLLAAFPSPAAALAAIAAVRTLTVSADAAWRMALSCDPYRSDPGAELVAICGLAHAGQILLSARSAGPLAEALAPAAELIPLGSQSLRDLHTTTDLFQLNLPGAPTTFPPLRTPQRYTHNLPPQLTSFVGRRREIATLKRHLRTGRITTLTGPGGGGKTRLALQVGAELLERFPDGLFFIDLAPVSDPDLVPEVVASALRVGEQPGRSRLETLQERLTPQKVLLILDNCEHLLTSCARVVSSLLLSCPEVVILTTSREPLGVAGELVWPIPPLSVPDDSTPPNRLMGYESAHLFVERAQGASAGFRLTSAGAEALARICRRLDGIPLAIELAAARTRVLTPEQIASRLDDHLRLLTAGPRGHLPRHQTLRAAIDWSVGLLSESERTLWQRLSVFAGDFSLEAAEAVGGAPPLEGPAVLDLLAHLVDKSLVVAHEIRGEKRYRMLETIRQYGQELLQQSGENDLIRRAHRDFFLDLTLRAEKQLSGPDQAAWMDRLDQEKENIRLALEHSMAQGDLDQAYAIGAAMWWPWFRRGQVRENYDRLMRLANLPGATPSSQQAETLNGLASCASYLGDPEMADQFYRRSIAVHEQVGNRVGAVAARINQSILLLRRGEYGEGRRNLETAIETVRELNRPGILGVALNILGHCLYDEGKLPEARRVLEEALQVGTNAANDHTITGAHEYLGGVLLGLGDLEGAQAHYELTMALGEKLGEKVVIAHAHQGLGDCDLQRGRLPEARERYLQALGIVRVVGSWLGTALILEALAGVDAAEGHHLRALRLAGAAAGLRRRYSIARSPYQRSCLEQSLAPARRNLSEEVAAEAYAAGERLSLENIFDLATTPDPARSEAPPAPSETAPPPPPLTRVALSPREQEIVRLVAQGLTGREIAQRLHLSPRTVEKHEENIRLKLDAPNRAALVVWAVRNGLL